MSKGEDLALTVRFSAAVEKAGRSIPRLSKELICKYLSDLRLLGVLEEPVLSGQARSEAR
jgi:hypothetical protein